MREEMKSWGDDVLVRYAAIIILSLILGLFHSQLTQADPQFIPIRE